MSYLSCRVEIPVSDVKNCTGCAFTRRSFFPTVGKNLAIVRSLAGRNRYRGTVLLEFEPKSTDYLTVNG